MLFEWKQRWKTKYIQKQQKKKFKLKGRKEKHKFVRVKQHNESYMTMGGRQCCDGVSVSISVGTQAS